MMCSATTTVRILVAGDTSLGHQRVDVTPMRAQFVITAITDMSSSTLSHTPMPPLFKAIGRRLLLSDIMMQHQGLTLELRTSRR